MRICALVVMAILSSTQAFAQTPTQQSALVATEKKTLGWNKTANLGVNLSFTSSQDVVGQTDGNSETYGLNLKSGFNKLEERYEWRNDVSYVGSTTRTPNVPRFVKSSDELKLATMYLHFWNGNQNVGPYARAEAAAPVFKGEDVQSGNKTYRVRYTDRVDDVFTASSVRLTDGFRPLTTKEGVGVFWRPKNEPDLKIETRAGVAALQVKAANMFASKGANKDGEIVIEELRDINQLGAELGVYLKGRIDERSAYELGLEAMTPFVTNQQSSDNRDAIALTNVDAYAKLTSNITKWAAFGYDYKLKIQPQLVERAQQIHMIVLNVNYNLF